ncbi:alpha-mannosidase [Paenibacillus sp. JJ-223]|uniref:alpha-mannosidase n=1 Tax=Paenibacillus sp. JJ-223 TaxID=2905647 RepID=UPI001F1ACCC1|nr:alpha-mannosidase [Paenibacillus sp. JJ-223]CAH1201449.1 Mannosylglycerate hydrolase [Paenibacillus sp. JJ-223]
MTTSKRAHIISHTHWDREWYLPYEKHHMRLVRLMDSLLDRLDEEPEFRSFYLDGQTIIIEDYLQVRPGQRERLEHHIRSGRIIIGPWYILQDAFLTSGEAHVRNMQTGHRDARRYGMPAKIGYFPDTFGLVGQTPQLMRQSGIDNVFFGRGVKPTGFNNTVSDEGYESSYSELTWEGPDGSQVLGILFANWYSNGNEIPADEASARSYWHTKLADAVKYASTDELLYMNGCDHQPIQLDLPEALRVARKLHPDVEFVHSSLEDYLDALKASSTRELSVVKGELRSQRTDGWGTLVNTASARVYLKQMNQKGQALLEKVAEPLASIAYTLGHAYPHDQLDYAWKMLMQNHPHDSICGCSVDEVHREMVTRFDKSRHAAEALIEDSSRAIAEAVDTRRFGEYGNDARPLVVFNTSGWVRSGVVQMEMDAARLYFRDGLGLEENASRMKSIDLSRYLLVDDQGGQVDCTLEDMGLQFGYDLPDDRFRQPYSSRRVKLTFEAGQVPALGWKTYALVKADRAERDERGRATADRSLNGESSLLRHDRGMENDKFIVRIADNGSFSIQDKRTGQVYNDQGIFENTGDIGNEYMFRQPDGEAPLTTRDLRADIHVVEDTPYRAAYEIVHQWSIPESADAKLDEEQRELVYYPNRKANRSNKTTVLTIRTRVSLERNGEGVEMAVKLDNHARDHRVRVLFPTDLEADVHRVDSIFEIATRDNIPASEWQNPSNTQHQQCFVDVGGEQAGLTVANLGLNEYEVLRDERNTIAVTLLRAVGELGDWGYFPTPEAQCQGEHEFHLCLIPHDGNGATNGAYRTAYQFQIPWTAAQTGVHPGTLASCHAPFDWHGEGVAFSSLKVNEETGDLMLRWYNMTGEGTALKVTLPKADAQPRAALYKSNILEIPGESVAPIGAHAPEKKEGTSMLRESWLVSAGPCEIITIGIRR